MKGNKTILGSILAISLVSIILAGSYTGAFFKDVETSEDNSFSAGTFDFHIQCGGYNYQDDIGFVWNLLDIKPGDTISSRSFNFKNVGTIPANNMKITCDYSVIEEDPCIESDTDCYTDQHPMTMAANFTITILRVNENGGTDTNLLPNLIDWNGNGKKDLQDLKESGVKTTIVPDVGGTSWTTVTVGLKFDEDADNDFQGDTFNLTMIFTLNQDASQ